ncbi:hypothetical protein [Clostridium septicum]|uniref:Cell division protein FtsZ n=1 Tax=Clostridium septicum TaxID=1504 RepID=A0A9N7JK94_CLOSE|nr:hypothetical protein [Clostridium septicum]AYE34139.1 hypothetical protein CP523_06460 [Clostridium septicum]QAS59507.1 hypothetical protein EI377_00940 [Clostridium septicum]UEC21232.1 hypothetical protein LK444_02320 [Clostridium septicum]USS00722.1 hypothetical protein NH397_14770 [Clostridium septicum]WLF69263.1 hypothetical protein Q6375_15000 [Clostridium septicum]
MSIDAKIIVILLGDIENDLLDKGEIKELYPIVLKSNDVVSYIKRKEIYINNLNIQVLNMFDFNLEKLKFCSEYIRGYDLVVVLSNIKTKDHEEILLNGIKEIKGKGKKLISIVNNRNENFIKNLSKICAVANVKSSSNDFSFLSYVLSKTIIHSYSNINTEGIIDYYITKTGKEEGLGRGIVNILTEYKNLQYYKRISFSIMSGNNITIEDEYQVFDVIKEYSRDDAYINKYIYQDNYFEDNWIISIISIN